MKTTTIAPQADAQLAIPQTNTRVKAKAQSGGFDFKDMLSGAISGMKNTAEKPDGAARTAGKTDAKGPVERPRDRTAEVNDTQPEHKDAEPDAVTTANAAAMQLQVQPAADAQQDIVEADGEVSIEAAQAVQAIPTQTWTVQTQSETEPRTQDVQMPEQAGTADEAQQTQVHTQTADIQAQASGDVQAEQTAQAARGQDNARERTAVQNRVQAQPRQTAQTAQQPAEQRQTLPEEAADDIVSAEVVRQPDRELHAQAVRQAETDPAQARFDDMLAKARQELDRTGSVPVQEQTADTVQQAQAADGPEIPETQVPVHEQKAAISEEENVHAEVRQPDEMESEIEPAKAGTDTAERAERAPRSERVERAERKPAKTVLKTGETDAALVQPKTQRTAQPEVTRTERQQPAQTARTPDQFEQIRAQVMRNLDDQKMEFNMQLHPKELGKVDVKMILEGGKLAVEIVTANAKAAELLNKQTEGLISSLRLGNLELTSVNVVTAGQNASGSMDGEYNLGNFQNQAGQQEARGSKANADERGGQTEAAGQTADETAERQPRGILNYSI